MTGSNNPSMDQWNNGSITNPVQEKSYAFAVDIVLFCRRQQQDKHEYILSKQLLKSGTSIGANVEEAQRPQSRADFCSKMSIALKEAYETRYWLRLIRDSQLAPSSEVQKYLESLEHIIRLLGAITSSSRKKALIH